MANGGSYQKHLPKIMSHGHELMCLSMPASQRRCCGCCETRSDLPVRNLAAGCLYAGHAPCIWMAKRSGPALRRCRAQKDARDLPLRSYAATIGGKQLGLGFSWSRTAAHMICPDWQ